jgi:hypothetical protein
MSLNLATAAALGLPPRFKYDLLVDRIVGGHGGWVKVGLEELQGSSVPAKHSALLQAGHKRGLRFSCTFRAIGLCYARLVVPEKLDATGNPEAASTAVSQ